MEPCQFNEDIHNLKKAVFLGNGQPSMIVQLSNISTKVENIDKTIHGWDQKMGELLDFKAGELAVKENKWEIIKTWGLYIGIIVSIIIAIYK